MAKAHSRLVADEYLRLGWTLVTEFREAPDHEPNEYYFEWRREDPPVYLDWTAFHQTHSRGSSAENARQR
jgi:hypothetical protein